MNLDKVLYHLKKSEEELSNQKQQDYSRVILDDTEYKLAMARLYYVLDNFKNKPSSP